MAGMDECPEGNLERMPRGAKLVVTAGVVFLLPLLVGILGAYLVGQFATTEGGRVGWQLGGLVAGLLVGVAIARVLTAWMGFRVGEDQEPSEPGAPATGQGSEDETAAQQS